MNDAKLPSILPSSVRARAGAIALGLLSLAWMTPASAWVIDFTGIPKGTVINEDVYGRFDLGDGLSAGFSATRREGPPPAERRHDPGNKLVMFNTDPGEWTGNDNDLEGPFERESGGDFRSPGMVGILQQDDEVDCTATLCDDPNDIGARPAGTFFVDFDFDIIFKSIDFFDIEKKEDGSSPDNAIRLYDKDDGLIHTTYTPFTGNNKWDRLAIDSDEGVAGVRRVEIRMGGSGAIDNFLGDFRREMPEPSSLILLLCGLAGLGLRRRAR